MWYQCKDTKEKSVYLDKDQKYRQLIFFNQGAQTIQWIKDS